MNLLEGKIACVPDDFISVRSKDIDYRQMFIGGREALEEVHLEFSKLLSPFGKVVIAGGAPRDVAHNRCPRDFDVFILGVKNHGEVKQQIYKLLTASFGRITAYDSGALADKSGEFSVTSFLYKNYKVEIITRQQETVLDLLKDFDICNSMYAYENNRIQSILAYDDTSGLMSPHMLGFNKDDFLYLNPFLKEIAHPYNTMHRLFKFKERCGVAVRREVIDKVASAIVETKLKNAHKLDLNF